MDRPHSKLGLALAGGGFRASLFHVGVLRRLAELDILRRVEVLSTVSGGSITGALYVLLLKEFLERIPGGNLTRDDYIDLVERLQCILEKGVQKNLRTRLFMNPLGILGVMLTGDSLGRRMARIYERYLLSPVVRQLKGISRPPWWRPGWLWPGQIRMRELVITPHGQSAIDDVNDENAKRRAAEKSVVTALVVNATSLNSGGRFHFSAVEVGDWYLGYFRECDFAKLLARKALLALPDSELRAIASGEARPPETAAADGGQDGSARGYEWSTGEAERAAALALRRNRVIAGAAMPTLHDAWKSLFAVPGFPGHFDDAELGRLRRAKLAAWYLRVGRHRDSPALARRSLEEHLARFWSALHDIDPDLTNRLEAHAQRNDAVVAAAQDYILELYLLRSAERVSHGIGRHWENIRVGHAVGASACFPPVFPPFLFHGVYDDLHVRRLGLTDGGVYDNIGITALFDEGCTEVIASDTSGLFDVAPVSPGGRAGLALRIPEILMRAIGGLQHEALRGRSRVSRMFSELRPETEAAPVPPPERLDAVRAGRQLDSLGQLDSVVYFHIASPLVEPDPSGAEQPFDPPDRFRARPRDIARLRTDLDGFGETEVAALVSHGHDLADRYIRHYAPQLVRVSQKIAHERRLPLPDLEPAHTTRVLAAGGSRFFRALKLRSPVSWAFTIAAAILLIAFAWIRGLTLEGIVGAAGGLLASEIELLNSVAEALLPRLDQPASRAPIVLTFFLVLLAAGLIISVSRLPRPSEGSSPPSLSPLRLYAFIRKWVRSLSGNWLWLVLGCPLIVALACALVSGISHVFFHLPFMAAARIRLATHTMRSAGAPVPGPPSYPQATGDNAGIPVDSMASPVE